MNDEARIWLTELARYVKSGDIPISQAHAAIATATKNEAQRKAYVAELDAMCMNGHRDSYYAGVDLAALEANDLEETWLVDDVWPEGRQVHMHAPRKTGKSLVSLWIAACLAIGVEPFTGRKIEPRRVAYVDNEMTLLDLKQRLFDEMRFTAAQLVGRLLYLQHEVRAPLDTLEGGSLFVGNMEAMQVQAVIIDAFSRVVKGEENNNDTYRDFYRYTGEPLKAKGISLWRDDNEGHMQGRSRGASAKADDVDLVWQLKATETGLQLTRMATRIGNVPESVALTMDEEPLRFRRGLRSWPVGVFAKAAEMDSLGISLVATFSEAKRAFDAAGLAIGRKAMALTALRYRREIGGLA